MYHQTVRALFYLKLETNFDLLFIIRIILHQKIYVFVVCVRGFVIKLLSDHLVISELRLFAESLRTWARNKFKNV